MSHLLTVIRQVEGQVKLNWGMIRGCSARQNMVHEGCISQKAVDNQGKWLASLV